MAKKKSSKRKTTGRKKRKPEIPNFSKLKKAPISNGPGITEQTLPSIFQPQPLIIAPPPPTMYVLDAFSTDDIKRWADQRDGMLAYEAEYYAQLASQRANLSDELRKSINEVSVGPHEIKSLQRLVSIKYAAKPLSSKGSLLNDPGGRFNIGDIDPLRFPSFPALYLGSDKATCVLETYGEVMEGAELDRLQLALADRDSMAIYEVNGKLETIFDLTIKENLKPFLQLINKFHLPSHLTKLAEDLGFPTPRLVSTLEELYLSLTDENWRVRPMQFDVPANPQIFGQIVMDVGIQAIKFKSTKSSGICYVIFPDNFEDSSAYLELGGEVPLWVETTKLDSSTFKTYRDL